MRIAVMVVALVACKAKRDKEIAVPVTAEEVTAQIGSDSAGSGSAPAPASLECEEYQSAIAALIACDKIPAEAKQTLIDAFEGRNWTFADQPGGCKRMADAFRQTLAAVDCNASTGSRDVATERGVPLDRAVLGSMPRPFGALQPIKPTMTRDEILAAIPDARRDGEDLVVPLGVETLTAKIVIDSTDHISFIAITMVPFPAELFEQAWGASPARVWFDRTAMWRAEYGIDASSLQIFPYKRFADVIGTGPDLLAEKTPLIGQPIAVLREKLGGRIDDWSDTDDDGNEVTQSRLLLPATELCRHESRYVLEMYDYVVTGATLTQCYDNAEARKAEMAAMEKRWGRATPARTADDRLVFRFSRPGRIVEMTEDPTEEPEGAWVVKIRAR